LDEDAPERQPRINNLDRVFNGAARYGPDPVTGRGHR